MTDTDYCDCPRQGDMWLCRSGDATGPRVCEPGTGRGCALLATVAATGRDTWNASAERELKTRPCGCGRPARIAA